MPLNVGLALGALLFDKSVSLVCILSLAPLKVNKFVEVSVPMLVVEGNTIVPVNEGLALGALLLDKSVS